MQPKTGWFGSKNTEKAPMVQNQERPPLIILSTNHSNSAVISNHKLKFSKNYNVPSPMTSTCWAHPADEMAKYIKLICGNHILM